jgi:ferrochelatase
MSKLLREPPHRHDTASSTAVVLVNLGTPEAPTAPALKRYLRSFSLTRGLLKFQNRSGG